ncbi:winged helix-turn-helix domain-containing protein [Nonomuraea diastatica]|uniref:winged helix-turn-helix domain-containing protein n=1 Tax=Nonomuraea diastatica TaxID=1848329 RepID=UPI00248249DA|nr:winged helix-turn-helix domain-containing protein [Nonomuraea diastatica]
MAVIIRKQIKNGELGPRDRIPSESEMVRDHGVARDTARQAVALLREEGWVLTLPQRGSFSPTGRAGRRRAPRLARGVSRRPG